MDDDDEDGDEGNDGSDGVMKGIMKMLRVRGKMG